MRATLQALPRSTGPYSFVCRCILLGVGLALCLVGYGVFLTPSTSRLSIAAAVTVLLSYAAIGRFVVPVLSGRYALAVEVAKWAGLTAGTIFGAEICLEYLFLPKNNAPWGMVEFGLVFSVYACAGIWLALVRRSIREAMTASTLSAVVSSVIWCIFILATFYLFYGTARQRQVFDAEGDFEDFRRSGMSNFPAFITEDFFGATFFHLILGPVVASILGLAAGAVGTALTMVRKWRAHT